MTIKSVDSKGRVSLGRRFANQIVDVEEVGQTVVRITLANPASPHETWLHGNRDAKASVLRGIEQARAGKTAKTPDLIANLHLVENLGE